MKQKQQFFSMDDWRADQRQKERDKRDGWRMGRAIHDTINAWLDVCDRDNICTIIGSAASSIVKQATWELRVWARSSTRYAVIVLEGGTVELYRTN
jgi:hypothetical protein